MTLVDEKNRRVGALRKTLADYADFVYHTLIMRVYVSHPAAAYRLQPVLALGGYDESTGPAEDKDLWRKLALARWDARIVPEELVRYRLHDAQLSQTRAAYQREVDARSQERFLAELAPAANHAAVRMLLADDPALWHGAADAAETLAGVDAALVGARDRLALSPAEAAVLERLVAARLVHVAAARPWSSRAPAPSRATELPHGRDRLHRPCRARSSRPCASPEQPLPADSVQRLPASATERVARGPPAGSTHGSSEAGDGRGSTAPGVRGDRRAARPVDGAQHPSRRRPLHDLAEAVGRRGEAPPRRAGRLRPLRRTDRRVARARPRLPGGDVRARARRTGSRASSRSKAARRTSKRPASPHVRSASPTASTSSSATFATSPGSDTVSSTSSCASGSCTTSMDPTSSRSSSDSRRRAGARSFSTRTCRSRRKASSTHSGAVYRGESLFEHDPSSSAEQRLEALWSSLDNPTAWIPTKPSLLSLLARIGFTSVSECWVPAEPEKTPGRITALALKGASQEPQLVPAPPSDRATVPERPPLGARLPRTALWRTRPPAATLHPQARPPRTRRRDTPTLTLGSPDMLDDGSAHAGNVRLSIVVATTGRPTLAAAVASATTQMLPGDELLVVFDASGDAGDTPGIVSSTRCTAHTSRSSTTTTKYAAWCAGGHAAIRAHAPWKGRDLPDRYGGVGRRMGRARSHVERNGHVPPAEPPGQDRPLRTRSRYSGRPSRATARLIVETVANLGEPVWCKDVITTIRPVKSPLTRLRFRLTLGRRLKRALGMSVPEIRGAAPRYEEARVWAAAYLAAHSPSNAPPT